MANIDNLPATTLLVHFSPRCNSIHSHKEQIGRLDKPKQRIDIMEYIAEYLLFGDAEVHIRVVWMGTVMYDSIHIQVHVVELRQLHSKITII